MSECYSALVLYRYTEPGSFITGYSMALALGLVWLTVFYDFTLLLG